MTDKPALVADIGGTNTRVALADGPTLREGSVARFRNADHGDLGAVLAAYLERSGARPGKACVAMAGPVRDGTGQLTNLDWTVTQADVAAATGADEVAVLNDMQAQGHALPYLGGESLRTLRKGLRAQPGAARLIVGVGTGFNVAVVHSAGGGVLVPASEAGHAGLPVQTEEDLDLALELERVHGYPSVEEVLSGRGLVHVQSWLAERRGAAALEGSNAVMEACAAGDDTAREAVRIFVRVLGQTAGNLALVLLPFGGIYLIGGMARTMVPWLEPFGFAEAFDDKGRFSDFMEQFPVMVVEDDYAALIGAAAHLADHL